MLLPCELWGHVVINVKLLYLLRIVWWGVSHLVFLLILGGSQGGVWGEIERNLGLHRGWRGFHWLYWWQQVWINVHIFLLACPTTGIWNWPDICGYLSFKSHVLEKIFDLIGPFLWSYLQFLFSCPVNRGNTLFPCISSAALFNDIYQIIDCLFNHSGQVFLMQRRELLWMITLLSSCHGMTTSGVTGIHSNSISFLDRSQNIRVHCFKKKKSVPYWCIVVSFLLRQN